MGRDRIIEIKQRNIYYEYLEERKMFCSNIYLFTLASLTYGNVKYQNTKYIKRRNASKK